MTTHKTTPPPLASSSIFTLAQSLTTEQPQASGGSSSAPTAVTRPYPADKTLVNSTQTSWWQQQLKDNDDAAKRLTGVAREVHQAIRSITHQALQLNPAATDNDVKKFVIGRLAAGATTDHEIASSGDISINSASDTRRLLQKQHPHLAALGQHFPPYIVGLPRTTVGFGEAASDLTKQTMKLITEGVDAARIVYRLGVSPQRAIPETLRAMGTVDSGHWAQQRKIMMKCYLAWQHNWKPPAPI